MHLCVSTSSFYDLVTSAPSEYLAGFGKLFEAARAAHGRMRFRFCIARAGAHVSTSCFFPLGNLDFPMVFGQIRRSIRDGARSARPNDGFGFSLRARAPAHPPAHFFYFVTTACLRRVGGFETLFKAARAAQDRIMVLFLHRVCGRPCIHQQIFVAESLGFSRVFTRVQVLIRGSAAAHDRLMVSLLHCECTRSCIHQLILFTWLPQLSYCI